MRASEVRARARAPRWVVPAVRAGLALADAALAAASFVLAFRLREGEPVFAGSAGAAWSEAFAPYGALLFLVVPIRVLAFFYFDLYRLRGEFSLVEDGVRVFKAALVGSLLITTAAFLYRGGYEFRAFSYARGVFVLDFALALAFSLALRFAARAAQIVIRRRGVNLIPTLIVGRGREASLCVAEMRGRPELGYRIIGVVESEPVGVGAPPSSSASSGDAAGEFEGLPVVGRVEELAELLRETRANEVIITDPNVSRDLLFEVMMGAGRRSGVEFRLAPSLFSFLPRKTEVDQIGALPMIKLFREPLPRAARAAKRASDILLAGAALLVLAPVWLAVALLIKLDSRGPVFYRQERVGMDGRLFLFYKFRTMRADSDDRAHREFQRKYIAGRDDTNLGARERPVYKMRDDPRITRVGRVLRRLSLDELPQLWNVLRGDMSVVGPRPPIPYEVEAYDLWHRQRLDMKPGLTGLWQVSGRNSLSFEEMVKLDLFYIENWSPLLDLKIILKTLPVMLRGDDAY
ncbi:MAG TPA: sugar transferase [Pyrinomonadaceae bacterium]|nr:sugar transferase [Pyrinomonadaceae bacterium]